MIFIRDPSFDVKYKCAKSGFTSKCAETGFTFKCTETGFTFKCAEHSFEIVRIIFTMSDNETPEQVAANEKRLQESHAAALDVLVADPVGRRLLQERVNQLAGPSGNATPAPAAPTPGPSVDTTAVLKDLVQVLADKTASKKAKRKSKKAAKNKPKRAKPSGGGNTTTDTSSSSDSEDGGREDPIPQPLQRPYGKGSYDRETDDLFTQDGELSLKLLSHDLCRRFLPVCS